MADSPRYVYGFARAEDAQAFAETGIGDPGRPVEVVRRAGLAALVSDAPADPVVADRGNLDAHSRVLQSAFDSFPVLPMRFGIVFPDDRRLEDEVLVRCRDQLEGLLETVAGRAEHRVTAYYEENVVLREVVAENPAISQLRAQIQEVSADAGYYMRIRLGELVAEAMGRKRRAEGASILERLRPIASAVEPHDDLPEAVVMKASFLVERAREAEFDRTIEDLARRAEGRMRFKRVGPLPPYSFVDVRLPAPNGGG